MFLYLSKQKFDEKNFVFKYSAALCGQAEKREMTLFRGKAKVSLYHQLHLNQLCHEIRMFTKCFGRSTHEWGVFTYKSVPDFNVYKIQPIMSKHAVSQETKILWAKMFY